MTADHDVREAIESFIDAFNHGDAEAVDKMFEEHGVLVPAPGQPMTGDARRAAQKHLIGFGLPMHADIRQIYRADDIALVLVDWTIKGKTPDGHDVDLQGTSTDVVRLGADGVWRIALDNPYGTA
ncbi:YybH family protein [Kibdelosporangium phytohabitans]|uniref:Hydrolase n=1 Tax=Kibdelosporangium phytohabitans TaxID=860235 RepID=A0A0N9IAP3_9PSEU|nr:DUF4440 domain-containing protein [Kibdelosporangium phytohabitans]ALG11556.1 hydrolase [Kibdelosporangium phytohabitans]MBE1462921.1 uncharacterized protein (TIGR02246 family) [Kibdelosporangium phytohabitans]